MLVSPAKKRKGVYKFVTCEDLVYETTLKDIDFENDWLSIQPDGTVTVKGTCHNGYAWDGCTPKWNFLDLVLIGTPDGREIVGTQKPITYYASLIHDILLQFRKEIGIERKDADTIFLSYLGDYSLRHLYYGAVRFYGILLGLFERK